MPNWLLLALLVLSMLVALSGVVLAAMAAADPEGCGGALLALAGFLFVVGVIGALIFGGARVWRTVAASEAAPATAGCDDEGGSDTEYAFLTHPGEQRQARARDAGATGV